MNNIMNIIKDILFVILIFFLCIIVYFIFIVLIVAVNSVQPKYPESGNFENYGFYVDSTYERTSDRNPFTSPNKSNKDTLTLKEIKDSWLKFDNGESLKFHSDSMNQYYWKKL
jgi:hypothetical protein